MSVQIDDLETFLSMEQLTEFDMGKYTMKLLQGTNRLYKIKTENSISLMLTMLKFRQETRFCDVIFSVNGQHFPAHKIVLASASPFLCDLFQKHQQHQIIDFSSYATSPVIMNSFLDFFYTSEVQLDEKSVRENKFYYSTNDLIDF